MPSPTTESEPATDALLCERCGYELSDLPLESVCPECGVPLAESHPDRRPGTRWQRAWRERSARLLFAWIVTTLRGLVAPARQLRGATIAPQGMRVLLFVNTTIASLLLTIQSAGAIGATVVSLWPVVLSPTPAVLLGPTWPLASVAATFILWFALIAFLTRIERIGIHFYSRRRQWRIGPVASLVGTAHASGAWIAAALGAALLPIAIGRTVDALPAGLGASLAGVYLVAGPLGFIAGMIWFEIATYFGLRACRFANPPHVRLTDA